jgi:hypothetical protein
MPVFAGVAYFFYGNSGLLLVLLIVLPSRHLTNVINRDDEYFRCVEDLKNLIEKERSNTFI